MRIEEEYAATTARPQQSCQGRVEESTRSRSVRSLWPGALIPSESTNDKKQVQTNNFFSRIYALLCRVYTFSFELFVLIFNIFRILCQKSTKIIFLALRLTRSLAFSWKSLEISNYDYNSEQLIRVWIILYHIVYIRFLIIFIINFS